MVTIPAPWENDRYMEGEIKDFYQYYATMMEPWDGPASIFYGRRCDGRGAGQKRSSPLRYYITDRDLILASEVGGIGVDQTHVVKKDRLRPGKMLLVDTKAGG